MKSPKRTISASGGPGSLQMVSELDTGRCASLLAVPRRGVDTRRCASKDAGPKGWWIWGHRTMCQPSRCSPKGVDTRRCASKDAGPQRGVDLGAVPHRLEEGKSASEDAGPEGGWIVMSHIG